MTDQCNRCRFWREDEAQRDPKDADWGFGRCRREPPRVSEAYVAALMPKLTYGQQADPDLGTVQMTSASLFPATAATDWCGGFAPVPSQDRIMAWVEDYERTRAAIDDPLTGEGSPDFDKLCKRMNLLESMAITTPAETPAGVIAKLFVLARIAGDGASPDEKLAMEAVEEAHSMLGFKPREA